MTPDLDALDDMRLLEATAAMDNVQETRLLACSG